VVLSVVGSSAPPSGPASPVILEPAAGPVPAGEPLTVRFSLPSRTQSWEVFVDYAYAGGGDGRADTHHITLSAGAHVLIVRATLSDDLTVQSETVEVTAT
jgi:hypothetical protein